MTLQAAINAREGNVVRNEIAVRALMDNPDAMIEALKDIGGDFAQVMNRCKDWCEMVNYNTFVFYLD